MGNIHKLLTVGGRLMLIGLFAGVLLQGCMEKGSVVINCVKGSKGGDSPGGEGCYTTKIPAGTNQSAQGFVGIGGANPVGAGITCGTDNICTSSGSSCTFTTKCKNTYTYPAG